MIHNIELNPRCWTESNTGGSVHDGTLNKKLANGRGEYVITNADAHSWPEVYSPTYGWLPFEPTPGFYNEDQPQLDTNRTTTAANTSTSSQASSSVTSSSARTSSRRSSQTTESKTTTKSATAIPRWLQMTLNLIGVLALLSSLPWLGLFVFQSASRRLTPAKYPRFYRQLLWLLRVVIKRPPAQPLIDYAADVDARLGLTNVFTALTVAYEAQEFGGRLMMPDVGKIDLLLGRLRVWVLRRGHI